MRTNTTHALRTAAVLLCLAWAPLALAQGDQQPENDAPRTIADRTDGMETLEGLMTVHLDHDEGTVWLELPGPDPDTGHIDEYIYVEALRAGLGSNPVGLDRGRLGATSFIDVRTLGGKVVFERRNTAYRASTDNPAERRAVRESFASSILWAAEIDLRDPDGRLLVDATDFVVRDAHGIAQTLRRSGQGSFSLDRDRSMADTHAALAFPDNIVLEAVLTFSASDPGGQVRATAPDPGAVTLAVRHMLVRPPDDGYERRRYDPRMPSFGISYIDYAAPLDRPMRPRWIARHRLEKADPTAETSPPIEPIVYHVDAGAPEPVRSALIEGASWWNEAFEAAGFENAFVVRELPADAHPLDVRYNVVQWVHRATRGWSYGASVTDPRTGEIIKGHVSLGSLRVRQDRRIFEGLAGTEKTGTGDPGDPVETALARIRQLSAHEVGHTLGFAHNFAASARDRESVMDYPAPLVRVRDDESLDFSEAYDVGVGAWDIHSVVYAYSDFPPGADEDAELERIVTDGLERGHVYMSDADARSPGSAHPTAHLWDNGDDPVEALEQTMRVREIALDNFGPDRVPEGRPLADLNDVFVPVYLYHRYQLEAAAKLIGGLDYRRNVRGDGQPLHETVDADDQRRALRAVLRAIEPEHLRVPDNALEALTPDTFGAARAREVFRGSTGPLFDPVAASGVISDLALSLLLHPQRVARVIEQARHDDNQLGPDEFGRDIIDAVFPRTSDPIRLAELRRQTQRVLVERLIGLAQSRGAGFAVRARADAMLRTIAARADGLRSPEHAAALSSMIARHLERGFQSGPPTRAADPAPPGSPIGGGLNPYHGCSWWPDDPRDR